YADRRACPRGASRDGRRRGLRPDRLGDGGLAGRAAAASLPGRSARPWAGRLRGARPRARRRRGLGRGPRGGCPRHGGPSAHRDRRGRRARRGRRLLARHLAGRGRGLRPLPHLRRGDAVPGAADRWRRRGRARGGRRRPRGGPLCRAPHPAASPDPRVIERAAILSTGDELTTGRIVATNASWIADQLFALGLDVVAVLTVGDYPERPLVVLPGVPREMKTMMDETVLPWLRTLRGGDVYLARVFQTFGLTESALDEMVAGLVEPAEARVSFRASFPEISLRIVVHGEPASAAARLEALAARIRERIGPYVYGA